MEVSLAQYSFPFAPWRPADGRVFDFFAFDSETTLIDEERPYITPAYVLGAACDGKRGFFIPRDRVSGFFSAHGGVPFACHNAAFDLRVIDQLLKPAIDIYQAVEQNLVWDTMIFKRLISLATEGHTARGEASLAACVKVHLGIDLDKEQADACGQIVRTNFGQFLGKPPTEIPIKYLTYLAQDAMATYLLACQLNSKIINVLQTSSQVFGYVGPEWLNQVYQRLGPLTHHVQVKAAIVMDALQTNGIGIDQERREEKCQAVQEIRESCERRLRERGYLVNEKGSSKAMQAILERFHRANPHVDLKRTKSGKQWSAAEDDLAELAADDPFFSDYAQYRQAEKLLSTYLGKMGRPRLYAKFGILLTTGRTYCGGGFNLQNLPKEKKLLDQDSAAVTIRGVFTPGAGKVFVDADYAQIELAVLAFVWRYQFNLGSRLYELINSGRDVHQLIAAAVLNKPVEDVSKAERNSAKAVSFGRPGGMSAGTLQKIAKINYGLDLTLDEVEGRIDAYHRLCPELDQHLADEVDAGLLIAHTLNLTPGEFCHATRGYPLLAAGENSAPEGFLGGMLLKVLRDDAPRTDNGNGRYYSPEELEFFWSKAQQLSNDLDDRLARDLANRQPSRDLWRAVRDKAGRRSVFTYSGRLRANASFCASRNTLFQGLAADGALLGLWRVWRAGHRIVAFIHDQIVVESPADERVLDR